MRMVHNGSRVAVALVCCLHGDEVFGRTVFDHFSSYAHKFPGLAVILANQRAVTAGARFIDRDLNRSFPGQKSSKYHEERLAAALLARLKDTSLLIDVHTTTVELELAAIVTKLESGEKRVLNAVPTREVVVMPHNLARQSLIGNVPHGISLEFGERFAELTGLSIMRSIVADVTDHRVRSPQGRKVFKIEGVLAQDADLPMGSTNLRKVRGRELYPFLYGEKAYTEHAGFWALSYRRLMV